MRAEDSGWWFGEGGCSPSPCSLLQDALTASPLNALSNGSISQTGIVYTTSDRNWEWYDAVIIATSYIGPMAKP